MPASIAIIIGIASLMLTGAGLLINKIWRDSESNSHNVRESLLQLNTQTNESNTRLTEQITRLSNAVSGLNATVLAQADAHSDFKLTCSEHKGTVNARLNDHSKRLNEHEKEITIIKAKIEK